MRAVFLAALAVAGCTKTETKTTTEPLDEAHVVEFLKHQPAAARDGIYAQVSPRVEHPRAIHRGENPLTLVGDTLDVGAAMPDVTLAEQQPDGKLGTVELGSLRGKLIVLSVVPSIDTRVCEAQTHAVSNAIAQLPPDTVVFTVSRDLPFAQTRFKEEAMTQTRMASDYHGGAFGQAMGLEIKETGLLARSVWVIDRAGNIAYRDLVDDQGDQPDYEALIAAVTRIAGS